MPDSSFTAEEIAERQLASALHLWRNNDFISALTLAGAAEEILGRRLKRIGREPTFEQLKKEILALTRSNGDLDPMTEKLIGGLLNQTRNELKHHAGDETITLDLRADAAEMLERAITNYRLLTGLVPDGAIEFWKDLSDT